MVFFIAFAGLVSTDECNFIAGFVTTYKGSWIGLKARFVMILLDGEGGHQNGT
jgi:hypothetical protein